MTELHLKVIGHFIANHKSDLDFIYTFHQFKRGKMSARDYHDHPKGFYQYLKDFRIIRNIYEGKTDDLLILTKKIVSTSNEPSVRKMTAAIFKLGISQPKQLTSLASKVLMLNDPRVIFPYDSKAKLALKFKSTDYETYRAAIRASRKLILRQYGETLKIIKPFLDTAEQPFKNKLPGMKKIRENRFLDKHLWLSGINNLDLSGNSLSR